MRARLQAADHGDILALPVQPQPELLHHKGAEGAVVEGFQDDIGVVERASLMRDNGDIGGAGSLEHVLKPLHRHWDDADRIHPAGNHLFDHRDLGGGLGAGGGCYDHLVAGIDAELANCGVHTVEPGDAAHLHHRGDGQAPAERLGAESGGGLTGRDHRAGLCQGRDGQAKAGDEGRELAARHHARRSFMAEALFPTFCEIASIGGDVPLFVESRSAGVLRF